ncbi:hypothetical protein [Rathayibacter festucae]|uniref:Uncharacterized protein n=1 Tax=Rathayibacter festucae DSM 15932 TaxID=1328866 RepID=A0A3Q9V0K9_9MICO|nr:hypothetical protein [Rathayibacter festucae]AZZ52619.1 hypothetical protein C1I64_11590 [Rathayibacter festucae DSM 15932]
MALTQLNKQIEALRARAAEMSSGLRDTQNAIDQDPTLSDQGKEEQKQDYVNQTKGALADLRSQENALVKAKTQELERALDATVGDGGADIIAFRDAQDRADRLEEEDDAKRLLSQAIRVGDKSLAFAVFRAGLDKAWPGVRDIFLAEYPQAAETVADLKQLQQYSANGLERTLSYAWFS